MTAKQLQKYLEDYGVDMTAAMSRFVDDMALYEQCLRLFIADDDFEALGRALSERDGQQVFEFAHAIKGVAANLGLTPICRPASEIVETVRNQMDDALIWQSDNLAQQYAEILLQRERFVELLASD